jgi:choline dehydrogenase
VRFPTRILEALGIETKVELPGVGENLIEQPNLILAFSGNLEPSSNAYHTFATAADLFGTDVAAVEASTLASLSKWAQAAVDASGNDALNVTAIEKLLQIQHDLLFKQNVTAAEILTVVAPQGLLASNYWILLPFSRGSVHLGSADKINEPLIDPRFFLADFDLNATVATGKLTQRFWLSEPMNNVVTGPLIPGPNLLPNDATDAQWETYVQESGEFFSRSLTCIGD